MNLLPLQQGYLPAELNTFRIARGFTLWHMPSSVPLVCNLKVSKDTKLT
jgi:hypothetical protein